MERGVSISQIFIEKEIFTKENMMWQMLISSNMNSL